MEDRSHTSAWLVAVLLLLCLSPRLDGFRLNRAEEDDEEVRHMVDSEAATAEVRPGLILFNGEDLDSVKTARQDLHGDSYQADSPGVPPHVFSGPPAAGANVHQQQWMLMNPSLSCGGNQMTFRAVGPETSYLELDRGPAQPLPLNQVPPSCGYSMQRNMMGLSLVVPYNGCNMIQENGCHVLPMRWQGIPVTLSCPTMGSIQPSHEVPPHVYPPYFYPPHLFWPPHPFSPTHEPSTTTTEPPTTETTTTDPPTTEETTPEVPPHFYPPHFYPPHFYPPHLFWPPQHFHSSPTHEPPTTTTTEPPTTEETTPEVPPHFYPPHFYPPYVYPPHLFWPPNLFSPTHEPPTTTTTEAPTTEETTPVIPPHYHPHYHPHNHFWYPYILPPTPSVMTTTTSPPQTQTTTTTTEPPTTEKTTPELPTHHHPHFHPHSWHTYLLYPTHPPVTTTTSPPQTQTKATTTEPPTTTKTTASTKQPIDFHLRLLPDGWQF